MNLWLSPHGIWYYRKVTTLPCGRRKEIKKSLQTRDKLCARHRNLALSLLRHQRPHQTSRAPSRWLWRPNRLLHSYQS